MSESAFYKQRGSVVAVDSCCYWLACGGGGAPKPMGEVVAKFMSWLIFLDLFSNLVGQIHLCGPLIAEEAPDIVWCSKSGQNVKLLKCSSNFTAYSVG